MEIAGKIIEIDVSRETSINNPPAATRFDELPVLIRETLTVIAKGVRNISGISYQRSDNQYIKYVGIVGQDLVESIFSFAEYELVVNFGWRGWEGSLPTPVPRSCSANPALTEKIIAYFDEAVITEVLRLPPLTSYYHEEPRPDKFGGTALTGVQPYLGNDIPDLTDSAVFIDLARKDIPSPARGGLAYTRARTDCKLDDYSVIEIDYDFGEQPAYFMSLGTNLDQNRLFLGVYGSIRVTDFHQGTIFEIVP
jgi:hypothetical protein